jgi:hypothetical protein
MGGFWNPIDFSGIVGYPHDISEDAIDNIPDYLIILMLVLTSWLSLSLSISGVIHLFMRMFLCDYLSLPLLVNGKVIGFMTHLIKHSRPYRICCMPS